MWIRIGCNAFFGVFHKNKVSGLCLLRPSRLSSRRSGHFDHRMFGQMDILGLSLYSTLGLKYDDFGRVLDPERFIPDPATNFLEFRIRIQPILFKHIWK